MKVRELHRVPNCKIGRVNKRNIKVEPHEDSTALYLTQFGFDIDIIEPRNTNKARTADIMMSGVMWEMKSPTSNNRATIKSVFRKAASQSDHIIFDLRRVKNHDKDVEKQLLTIFSGRGRVKKLMIIRQNGELLEFSK